MMKKGFLITAIALISWSLTAQTSSGYYLPSGISYDKTIPSPEEFTGNKVGEWHFSHDRLYSYMIRLADLSGRAVWEDYGRSYEGRPLGQLIISSPENIKNLEKLRQDHLLICDPSVSSGADLSNMPLVVKLGYGVHGNESSAQNASAIVAYYLVAGSGADIEELLSKTIILIDPALNPDGMQRHSSWVNMTRSLNNNPDPDSWEFAEPWPGGRTNHYWFDLNRDYLMLQHPESQGRVAAFYRWMPNINTDHHEMGANSTFFFQPGVQSRNNPLSAPDNQALTAEIGKYHEKYLNEIGSLYFTEEGYDDFYVGKGSSYPDIHGSIGILFEQAGVKGHLRETPGGILSFPFAIRNQVTVSLSSLDAGLHMRTKLLESMRNFYKEALSEADKYPVKAFIFTEPSDKGRVSAFIENLLGHHIRVYETTSSVTRNGITYNAGESYLVPLHQNEYRFIRSLFEPVKNFTDSVFYDISTWVMPMSFNISYDALNTTKETESLKGKELTSAPHSKGGLVGAEDAYAYLFEWNEYLAPKALYELQQAGVKTRVAMEKFTINTETGTRDFSYGTIMIPVTGQLSEAKELEKIITGVAENTGIIVYSVASGLTPKGSDLGSANFIPLTKPGIAMLAGDGSNSADAGEIWHLLDFRFGIPVTMLNPSKAGSADLGKYNVLIITGSPDLSQGTVEKIKAWNRAGGTIIGFENGNNWLVRNKVAEIEYLPAAEPKKRSSAYSARAGNSQVEQIPGSIFQVTADPSHPLCFGYSAKPFPVFISSADVAKKDAGLYNNPVCFTKTPLLSGYCTPENEERFKGAPFLSVHGNRIISLYGNTNFRAIWYGTNKLFMNALFFSQLLRPGQQMTYDE